jgi:phosphoribosylanthranilate isomerase
MTRVKICGITRPEDARAVEDAGADAIGLIFVPATKRFVEVEQAKRVVAALGPWLARVGVFRDAPLQVVLETVVQVGLNAVQLNGHESDDYVFEVAQYRPVIRAVTLRPGVPLLLPAADSVLVDGPDPGSGQKADWDRLSPEVLGGRRWILAGGLNPGNVSDAVRRLAPWAVDVSSGVETAPGVKDALLVRAFVQAAKLSTT